MRDKEVSTKGFRQLLNEIGMLLAYEVTRDLPLEMVEVETPIAKMMAPSISGKKLVFAPILRAGVGFLDGMLNLVPSARVAHIGLYRNPETLEAVEYYFKAPADVADRLVIVMDPMLATANSAVAAIDRLKARGVKDIRFVCLLAAPEGIERLDQGASRKSRSGRRRSTRSSTITAISCRASATRATACSGRSERSVRPLPRRRRPRRAWRLRAHWRASSTAPPCRAARSSAAAIGGALGGALVLRSRTSSSPAGRARAPEPNAVRALFRAAGGGSIAPSCWPSISAAAHDYRRGNGRRGWSTGATFCSRWRSAWR